MGCETKQRLLLHFALAFLVGCGDPDSASEESQVAPDYAPLACGVPADGPALKPHLTESDPEYLERFRNFDPSGLPKHYDLSALFELDRSMIGYMLDEVDLSELDRDTLLRRGDMGQAVLMALGPDPAPAMVDYRELRRGLYHFYNCDRGYPAQLDDFKTVFGDYTEWPSLLLEDSDPKIYPRRLHRNTELGIYVAETLRHGEVHETEILLDGFRNDGALEFLAYMPNGNIASRGEFTAGSSFTVGASPHTCMSCHLDPETYTYTVIFPVLSHHH